jgi:hypothetical protein
VEPVERYGERAKGISEPEVIEVVPRLVKPKPSAGDQCHHTGIMAFTMTRFSSVKPLYESFIVKINDRDWTVNIMMHGEIGLSLIAGNEFER